MKVLLYALNLMILFTGPLSCWLKTDDQRFSIALVRVMLCLPVMAAVYYRVFATPDEQWVQLTFLSESVFALVWFNTGYWLNKTYSPSSSPIPLYLLEFIVSIAIVMMILFFFNHCPASFLSNGTVKYSGCRIFIAANFFLLCAMSLMAWKLEAFWRGLTPKQRWEYKFLVIGSYLLCAALGWAVSYRFTYHQMKEIHFHLLVYLCLIAWGMIVYAVARHRLMNRKLFISRKIVYAFVAPLTFGIYLILIGTIAAVMQRFDLPFPLVLQWVMGIVGLVILALLIASGKIRHNVQYFVSTHFYINKYEYRDEWLGFSRRLQGAFTEMEVVDALYRVLSESLYTNLIFIWIGDETRGYRLALHAGIPLEKEKAAYQLFPDDEPVVSLKLSSGRSVYKTLIPELALVLYVPLTIGDQTVGIVGIGKEFTGGQYGKDDFDLLTALGSQAASALLTARMAEGAVRNRQQEAWDVMSAFILHDIKNAASMLSLLRENAPDHLHNPEFQADMLDTIDDALKRMKKVQHQLSILKRDIVPVWQKTDLCEALNRGIQKLSKRLHGLRIDFSCTRFFYSETDPEMVYHILENLLLNALEAGGDGTLITIDLTDCDPYFCIRFSDDGPGIPDVLLPDGLFKPFQTSKTGGSGIGLWQAKRLATLLGGNLTASNNDTRGACFELNLPKADH